MPARPVAREIGVRALVVILVYLHTSSKPSTPWQDPSIDYLDVADHMWPVLRRLMAAHARLYSATGGRVGGSIPGLPKLLVLEHVGAKTGKQRSTPLVYMPHGEDF